MENVADLQQSLQDSPTTGWEDINANKQFPYSGMGDIRLNFDDNIAESKVVYAEVLRGNMCALKNEALENGTLAYLRQLKGAFYVPFTACDFSGDAFMERNIKRITLTTAEGSDNASPINLQNDHIEVFVYHLSEDNSMCEDINHEGENINAASHLSLPSLAFDSLWESLVLESGIKEQLLSYAKTSLLYSELGVNSNLVSWNRVMLLYGPPGTGKTSLCKALAHKLAIRLSKYYPDGAELIEVNSHSLFSKWFSESGKLVMKMFQKIQEYVEDRQSLVCVLIDEVESLTAVRKAALSGNEPSDAIRVVNALLTPTGSAEKYPNVLILTTSNITGAIDLAFVDRADIRQYIGPPSVQAVYEILRSSLNELMRVKIIHPFEDLISHRMLNIGSSSEFNLSQKSLKLWQLAQMTQGISGRSLRKLPFVAHSRYLGKSRCTFDEFADAMETAIKTYQDEQSTFV